MLVTQKTGLLVTESSLVSETQVLAYPYPNEGRGSSDMASGRCPLRRRPG